MAKQEQGADKAKKAPKPNRVVLAGKVVGEIAGKTSLSELAGKVESLVAASGGEARPKESAWAVRKALQVAEGMGIVRLTRPTDVLVERVKPGK